jgi:hypothetical protein
MQNPSTTEVREAAQRLATRRVRARRGLVAGYIHELSARHADDARRDRPRPLVYGRTVTEPEATAGV